MDIKLDKCMVIETATCECGAGADPTTHCKHVPVVFYAVATFGTGSRLVTDLTCTEKLQTFHQTKSNTGTPMKRDILVTLRGLKHDPMFDPRPVKYRIIEGANDRILCACINHAAKHTDQRMPILQLTPPANIYALYDGHDYCDEHMSDHFLEINNQKIMDIEKSTRQQDTSGDWYAARQMRLTSSVFGRICKSKDKCDGWKNNGCLPCNGLSTHVCDMVKTRKAKLAADFLIRKKLKTKEIRHVKKYGAVAIKVLRSWMRVRWF